MAQAPKPIAADATAGLDFGAAFAAALKDDAPPAPAPAPAPATTAAGDPPAGDPPAGDPPADEGDEKTVDELAAEAAAANGDQGGEGDKGDEPDPAAKPAPAPAPAAGEGDSVTRLADLLTQRLQPQQQPGEPEPAPAPVLKPEDYYTPEERQIIAAYEKEWPDVARVEAIKRKGEYNMVVRHVFDQFVGQMRPVIDLVQQLAARQQYVDLKSLEPEYDELSDKVEEWVAGMPNGILKTAYSNAITQGSAEDLQQVFTAYRTATGTAAPATGQQKPVVTKPVTELPAQTKQAVAALAPVSTRRSAPPALVPETFEDAWELAAKTSD